MSDTTPAGRRIFITVAEVSGDQHAAHLIGSLRQLDPSLIIEGFGGPQMRAAGAIILQETVQSAAMGFSAARRAPEVFQLLRRAREHFKTHRPHLHICCDSWGMNSYFARQAHRVRVPVLYYIAPQVWASREGRVKKIRKWVNRLACILPFEEKYFQDRGVNTTFVGHPLFDELPVRTPPQIRTEFESSPPVVGLLPGSRRGEATSNFPSMLEIARQIRTAFPGTKFLVPTTPATDPVVRALVGKSVDIQIRKDAFDDIVPQCDLCITVSGTATLHVAGHYVPMLVVYRVRPAVWYLFGRWMVRTKTFALVNLLAGGDSHIVPEFVPWFGPSTNVGNLAIEFLQHPAKRIAQVQKLSELIRTLDKPGASINVARIAMEMIGDCVTTPVV